MADLVVCTQKQKHNLSPIKRKRFCWQLFRGDPTFHMDVRSVCLQANLPSLCPLRTPLPDIFSYSTQHHKWWSHHNVFSARLVTLFSSRGWKPMAGEEACSTCFPFEKKCLFPPSFSNTTQVFVSPLCQVGVGKMCLKGILLHCVI